MENINPSRPWIVGWYYALEWYFKNVFKKHPGRKKIWIGMIHKKYFWYTVEERTRSAEIVLKRLSNIKITH